QTGMRTELGRIAGMMRAAEPQPSPLQRRLDELGRGLALIALAFVAVIFLAGLLRGESFRLMFLTAVSTAVAAVPEGLPAVVTIALALGGRRMLKRGALIRRLAAVETLGSVTVICSDKTGTITENRMTVVALEVAGRRVDFGESPATDHPAMQLTLAGGALCNDALLEARSDKPGSLHIVGDPTEGALVLAAARVGLDKRELERSYPRVAELPFDSQRKRMTTVHRLTSPQATFLPPLGKLASGEPERAEKYVAFTKGAVDSLLTVSTKVWIDEQAEPLDGNWRQRILAAHDRLAGDGMRVLGVACRPLEWPLERSDAEALERDLIFAGMVGMIDPARPQAKAAAQTCKRAGIRPVMITGDHPLTARHIAGQLEAFADGRMLTGQEISRLTAGELQAVVDEVSVYARVSPEHKLNIVQALQNMGHIVAMTGDGVNDAPALQKADVGVAMGAGGTDVSREAADIILLDDNFATIVAAVEEGRVIYDNIRKFIRYLLTSNTFEILVILIGPFLGMPLPLLPLQILWMNLVTDGLPALALGVEPAERNVMDRPPRPPAERILDRSMVRTIAWVGLLATAVALAAGYRYWHGGSDLWRTIIFTTLILSQVSLAMGMRSERDSLFRVGLLSNKALLGALALTVALQAAVVYIPFWQRVFATRALPAKDLLLVLALSAVPLCGVELDKWLTRRREA
ncbi:MAG TPA: cation-translocating P-type ATPase, partial [Bryobacterales bacterium]|nr:cation-translocating P-type ATPase [Bryobacterales bacterium]